jgi:NADH-quinone oxidoreductase subunit J
MLGIASPPAALAAAADLTRSAGTPPASTSLLAQAAPPILPPVLLLVMCVVAGIATVLILPGRREASFRKMGGAGLLGLSLIGVALLVRYAADRGGGMGVYFWAFAAIALAGAVRVVTHPRPVYSALYFVLTVFASAGLFILLWAEFMAAALVLIYAGAILVTYVFVIMLATSVAPAEPGAGAGAAVDFDDEAIDDGNGDGNGVGRLATQAGEPPARQPDLAPIAEHDAVSRDPLIAAAVGFALMGVLLFVIFDRSAGLGGPHDRAGVAGAVREEPLVAQTTGATQKLGMYLFQHHVVSLELAGLLLTVSMVGAIIIARRRIVIPQPDEEQPFGGRLGAAAAAGAMSAIDDDPHAIPVYGTENPRQKEYPET